MILLLFFEQKRGGQMAFGRVAVPRRPLGSGTSGGRFSEPSLPILLLHADAVEIRAGISGAGIRATGCARLADDVALNG